MNITLPQLPAKLDEVDNFETLIMNDEVLYGISVKKADVSNLRVKALSLSEFKANGVKFSGATLEKTNFIDCIFMQCELTATVFASASWQRIAINGSRSSGLQLQNSTLKDVQFDDCKLNLANFRASKFKNVMFKNCDLTEADFYTAQLENVSFEHCTMDKAEFSGAQLKKVDLRSSDIVNILGINSLGGAIIDSTQLMSLAPALAAQYKIIVD